MDIPRPVSLSGGSPRASPRMSSGSTQLGASFKSSGSPLLDGELSNIGIDAAYEIPLQDEGKGHGHSHTHRGSTVRGSRLKFLLNAFMLVWPDGRAKKAVALGFLVWLLAGVTTAWGMAAGSLVVVTYMLLAWFDGYCILAELVALWAARQQPTSSHSFGYTQVDVLVVFSGCVLLFLAAFWSCMEGVEHLLVEDEHHTDGNGTSMVLFSAALATRLVGLVLARRHSYAHRYMPESSSSRLKHWLAALVQNTLGTGKLHRTILLARGVNTAAFVAIVTWGLLPLSQYLVRNHGLAKADPLCGLVVAVASAHTIMPMLTFDARILLQSLPSQSTPLAKCLRDAANLEGVLEIKNGHFWQNGYNEVIGSLHVRIRRDADPQLVLARMQAAFSAYVTNLTVQIRQDDWMGPANSMQGSVPTNTWAGPMMNQSASAVAVGHGHTHSHAHGVEDVGHGHSHHH